MLRGVCPSTLLLTLLVCVFVKVCVLWECFVEYKGDRNDGDQIFTVLASRDREGQHIICCSPFPLLVCPKLYVPLSCSCED